MKLGMIVRMDKTGLGLQSKRLARLLKPERLMVIDSTKFNGNEQFPDWYEGYESVTIDGFPDMSQIQNFVQGLDKVLTAESFYSNHFVDIARNMRVKTVQIFNYEFWDNLRNPFLAVANTLIQPSYWMLEEMRAKYPVYYLPTPLFDDEFKEVREVNMKRKGKRRFLFVAGKVAAYDRAGLSSLYEAMQLSKGDFEVVVKSQGDVVRHPDPRLIYDTSNPEDPAELYRDFDAMIHPRRYGGQSLPMTEALLAGLPVIMTNISPNNQVLPATWLVPAVKTDEFMARTIIDVYSASPEYLANMLDAWTLTGTDKAKAYELGKQYEAETLRPKYEELLK